jgi:hypothetical protein
MTKLNNLVNGAVIRLISIIFSLGVDIMLGSLENVLSLLRRDKSPNICNS